MDFHETLRQLNIKKETALQMGGDDRIRKQHAKGRLTARERIHQLLDRGSFFEMGLLAHSAMESMANKTPADGVICGYGTIADRRVADHCQ